MKSKTKILYILISLFLVVVFLDQNRTPVPVKILLGNPFHLGLSLIILISMAGRGGNDDWRRLSDEQEKREKIDEATNVRNPSPAER